MTLNSLFVLKLPLNANQPVNQPNRKNGDARLGAEQKVVFETMPHASATKHATNMAWSDTDDNILVSGMLLADTIFHFIWPINK